jgi:glycosyltransferase involved in cell wall biosynthesis
MIRTNDNHKRRIVFVLPALAAGGAERVMITLMNGLDPQAFERSLVAVNEDGPLRPLIDPAIRFHALGRGTRVSRTLHKLLFKLREIKPDIVISTMAHMNYGVLLLRHFLPGARIIVREAVSPSYFLQRNITGQSLIRAAYRILYPCADIVISPAGQIVDEFRTLGIPVKNFVLLPNPVDVEKIRNSGAPLRLPGVRYICAGRLDPQKGFDRLIENLPLLSAQKDWHLTIMGEGKQRPALEKLINDKGLKDRVELAGHAANPWPLIAGADAFLMPSRFEGLPNAVLEALACGTPVIATRESGGIAEIAAQAPAGSVTLVNDMDEFISAMAKVNPRPGDGLHPSLLPDAYERDAVIHQFSQLLEQVISSHA